MSHEICWMCKKTQSENQGLCKKCGNIKARERCEEAMSITGPAALVRATILISEVKQYLDAIK